MESDLKRGDVSRKSFRVPAKSRQAPAPPKSSTNVTTVTVEKTPIRLYNTTMSPSRPSTVEETLVAPATASVAVGMRLKTFETNECIDGGNVNQKPLKLADILRPNECNVINNTDNNDIVNNYKQLHINVMNTPKSSGIETSLDVLKDLEKRINRIEMNEKLKQSINSRNGMSDRGTQSTKNQYADRENLTKAGLNSSSTLSTNLEQTEENKISFFERNSNVRSSTGGTIALKTIIDENTSNDDDFLCKKPITRTVSDTKSIENSLQKLRINYMQKQFGQQQLQKQQSLQQNNSTAAIVVNSREHITSFAGSKNGPLSPLTSKKKENAIIVDKTKLTTNTINDSHPNTNISKLSHSSSLKRETLRHPITPMTTTSTPKTSTTMATMPTERSVKQNKKYQQVIWIRYIRFVVAVISVSDISAQNIQTTYREHTAISLFVCE